MEGYSVVKYYFVETCLPCLDFIWKIVGEVWFLLIGHFIIFSSYLIYMHQSQVSCEKKKSISEGLLSHLASEAPAANTLINYLKRSWERGFNSQSPHNTHTTLFHSIRFRVQCLAGQFTVLRMKGAQRSQEGEISCQVPADETITHTLLEYLI